MTVHVVINGGPVNVHTALGLTCNPFPVIPEAEYAVANRMLRELDSDPLPDADSVRKILDGCDPDFVELCVKNFVPGRRIGFSVTWPD